MPGKIFEHNNIIAVGEETFTGSLAGVTVEGLNDRIMFAKGTMRTASADKLVITEDIAADGKSFTLSAWEADGSACDAAVTVQWFAIIQ